MMTREQIDAFLSTLPAALDTEHGYVAAKVVAAAVRRDLDLAITAGVIPAGARFHVRSERKSINVDLIAWVGSPLRAIYEEALMQHLATQVELGHKRDLNISAKLWDRDALHAQLRSYDRRHLDVRLSDAVNDAANLAEVIANRHNYDKSDTQTDYFDVGYYLSCDAHDLAADAERGIRLAIDPAFRDLSDRATAAADRLGEKCVRSICGNGGVAGCCEYSMEQLLRVDVRAAGRPVAYDKRRRAWLPHDEVSARQHAHRAAAVPA